MTKTILIADDNDKNRKLLRVILRKNGFEVMEATNGEEAVAVARRRKPDCVLMDYRMPIMDGINATRCLKSSPELSAVPVFIVTSSAMQGDRERIMSESGCDELFTKPFDYEDIIAALKQRMGRTP